ncbi:MAG: diaminopimelate epimerase [Bacteroidetes bacterium]|nr:diaminopimelate epimerase [Bacteroidota bacterium]
MQFYKYQGTGNDFVMIDDRKNQFDVTNTALVKAWCDRRFGIGADGLILLRRCAEADFEMIYFNSDGNLSSMCGNGGRCIARFAQELKMIDSSCTFKAIDGLHQATLTKQEVALKMSDVKEVEIHNEEYYLNTGSPHWVKFATDLTTLNVAEEGKKIRYNDRFKTEGTNVNFVCFENNRLRIRTYERGVEDETLSCGTGITAAALAYSINAKYAAGSYTIALTAQGGNLNVRFDFDGQQSFTNIYLVGAAVKSFVGDIEI